MSESFSSLPQSVKDRIEKEVNEKMQPNLKGDMNKYESWAYDDMYEEFLTNILNIKLLIWV